jgi:hypothetical protein
MNCPAPDRLLATLAGEHGAAALSGAQAHVESCATCRAGLNAFIAPDVSLSRLLGHVEPATVGQCPDVEDLACWAAGDPLPLEKVARISIHAAECEACAFSSAQLKLELARTARQLNSGPPKHQSPSTSAPSGISAVSRAPVIAQVMGALALVAASMAILLPRFDQRDSRSEAPTEQVQAPRSAAAADWPFQASFEFRLEGLSASNRLMFPHHPGVHLSKDYDYALHFEARRTGWLLLFSTDPDERLSLLVPGDRGAGQIPRLEPGQSFRFPADLEWEPVAASSGRHELYAVYLDSVAAAEELVSEWNSAGVSGQRIAGLTEKLDQMVVANGCDSTGRPCVLTLEYEVF